jgi:hypothetical protein
LMLRGLWCDPWFCIGSELVFTFWGLTTLGWCYFFWIRVLRSERVRPHTGTYTNTQKQAAVSTWKTQNMLMTSEHSFWGEPMIIWKSLV